METAISQPVTSKRGTELRSTHPITRVDVLWNGSAQPRAMRKVSCPMPALGGAVLLSWHSSLSQSEQLTTTQLLRGVDPAQTALHPKVPVMCAESVSGRRGND